MDQRATKNLFISTVNKSHSFARENEWIFLCSTLWLRHPFEYMRVKNYEFYHWSMEQFFISERY